MIWKFLIYLISIHPNILFEYLCYNIIFLYIDMSSGGVDPPRPLLSYPNFVQGRSLANIWILASWIELLNTNCHTIRRVLWCFGRKCAKCSKERQNGHFGDIFQPLGPPESLGMKQPASWASFCATSSPHFPINRCEGLRGRVSASFVRSFHWN